VKCLNIQDAALERCGRAKKLRGTKSSNSDSSKSDLFVKRGLLDRIGWGGGGEGPTKRGGEVGQEGGDGEQTEKKMYRQREQMSTCCRGLPHSYLRSEVPMVAAVDTKTCGGEGKKCCSVKKKKISPYQNSRKKGRELTQNIASHLKGLPII